jgi:Tol biopolymer transport system component
MNLRKLLLAALAILGVLAGLGSSALAQPFQITQFDFERGNYYGGDYSRDWVIAVTNAGTSTYNGPLRVEVRLSDDLSFGNGDDFYLASWPNLGSFGVSLASGETIVFGPYNQQMPGNFTGTFSVIAQVTWTGGSSARTDETAKITLLPKTFPTTELISRASSFFGDDDGTGSANGISENPSVSRDGRYVAFASEATNLVTTPNGGFRQIYVRDTVTGEVRRISNSSSGVVGNGHSWNPSISADGRYIAFHSDASNLGDSDTNALTDVFVHDRLLGTTSLVSVTAGGGQGNQGAFLPSISGGGRYVVFESASTNLVPLNTGGHSQVYLKDRQTGELRLLSRSAAGVAGNGNSNRPKINPGGRYYNSLTDSDVESVARYVVFDSRASNLVEGDTNGRRDIFRVDITNGFIEAVSVPDDTAATSFAQNNGESSGPAINADGSVVGFTSLASNLVNGAVNTATSVFVRDFKTGRTELASLTPLGIAGNGYSEEPSLSDDGRFVTFRTGASDLLPLTITRSDGLTIPHDGGQIDQRAFVYGYSDNNLDSDVYLLDRTRQIAAEDRLVRVSVNRFGQQTYVAPHGSSRNAQISGNGRFIVFVSDAGGLQGLAHGRTNLQPLDQNGSRDVFIHDRKFAPASVLPDLAIDNVQFTPGLFETGYDIEVAVTVRNRGFAAIPANQPIAIDVILTQEGGFRDGADIVLGQIVWNQGLAAGQAVTIPRRLNIPSTTRASVFRLRAMVDPEAQILESVENNNAWISSPGQTIQTSGRPDLVVTSVGHTLRPYAPGETLSVSVAIANQGNAAVGIAPIPVNIVLSGNSILGDGDDLVVGQIMLLPVLVLNDQGQLEVSDALLEIVNAYFEEGGPFAGSTATRVFTQQWPAGVSRNVIIPITIPSLMPLKSYYLGAQVGAVANEIISTNNYALTPTASFEVRSPFEGTYIGTIGGAGTGRFGLVVRSSGTGAFVAYDSRNDRGYVQSQVSVGQDGRFAFTDATGQTLFSGQLSPTGLTGSSQNPSLSLFAQRTPTTGPRQNVAGFYTGIIDNDSQGSAYTVIGSDGQALVVILGSGVRDAALGVLPINAPFTLNTDRGGYVSGNLAVDRKAMLGSYTLGTVTRGITMVRDGAIAVRLVNISTRGNVGSSDDVMIAGFVINGAAPKKVLVRGIGPSLAQYGVSGVLANPSLELHSGSQKIGENGNWVDAANAEAIAATGFAPQNNLESALLMTLNPGSYTAILRGANNSTGNGLVEVYEINGPDEGEQASTLVNLSTRARVGTGDSVLIAGFVVDGVGERRLLIRTLGPTLKQYNVAGTIANPRMRLYRSGQDAALRISDNWDFETQRSEVIATGYAPGNPMEPAIVAVLEPGAYTVVVDGVTNGEGVALVEVYDVGQP